LAELVFLDEPAGRLIHEEHSHKKEGARKYLEGEWDAPFCRICGAGNVEGDAVIDEEG
jgi:hypothetical protein